MASLLDGLVSIVAQEALKYTVLSGTRLEQIYGTLVALTVASYLH